MKLFYLIAMLLCAAYAALPPGFEDEIYCPQNMCLRKRAKSHHLYRTGSRTMFVECFDPATQETCRPRAWGNKLDRSYLDSLLRENWHTDKCDLLLEYMLMGARVDAVVEKLATLSLLSG